MPTTSHRSPPWARCSEWAGSTQATPTGTTRPPTSSRRSNGRHRLADRHGGPRRGRAPLRRLVLAFDLEPVDPGCKVTLTYDWADVGPEVKEYLSFPPFGPDHLPDSLAHLASAATGRSPSGSNEAAH